MSWGGNVNVFALEFRSDFRDLASKDFSFISWCFFFFLISFSFVLFLRDFTEEKNFRRSKIVLRNVCNSRMIFFFYHRLFRSRNNFGDIFVLYNCFLRFLYVILIDNELIN